MSPRRTSPIPRRPRSKRYVTETRFPNPHIQTPYPIECERRYEEDKISSIDEIQRLPPPDEGQGRSERFFFSAEPTSCAYAQHSSLHITPTLRLIAHLLTRIPIEPHHSRIPPEATKRRMTSK